ncbi:hydroxymethylglutaryl-CoA synthase family protein (plasmid) [Streptomyces sp. BI20]|uniref:hydroxymethylglutaryl-CoA synthase family protein n=1 Tax=Streptomyces sp. BI20 TaxID=3403460 RepID=UPI003C7359AC
MRPTGIEDADAYLGLACVDVEDLVAARGMDPVRMRNLGMVRKTVPLPGEDVVTCAVNAATPLLARLDPARLATIELCVVGTESGIDLSKSAAAWIHGLLPLPRTCRVMEIKQACYAGVAALQTAAAHLAAADREARALVIGCDVPRPIRGSTAEPSQGAGAVAFLLGPDARLARAEHGAAGYHSFDVDDVRRPTPTDHVWDPDTSLLSYVRCLKEAFADYRRHRPGTDFLTTFDHLAFHTPFPGAVKGAHRSLMRGQGPHPPARIEADFTRRLRASLRHPEQVGNLYAGTTLLALLSVIDHAEPAEHTERVGVFSYGSGCSAEFCSYLLPAGRSPREGRDLTRALDARRLLDIDAYDTICDATDRLYAGVPDHVPDLTLTRELAASSPYPLLALERIEAHARHYTRLEHTPT